jgi:hypothetical protein
MLHLLCWFVSQHSEDDETAHFSSSIFFMVTTVAIGPTKPIKRQF